MSYLDKNEPSLFEKIIAPVVGAMPSAALTGASGILAVDEISKYLPTSGNVPDDTWLKLFRKEMKRLGVKRIFSLDMPGYDPISKSIIGISDSPAVMAHELGHAKTFNKIEKLFGPAGSKLHTALYGMGRPSSVLGGVAAGIAGLYGADSDTVRDIGLVGAAGTVPMLAEEVAASTHGFKDLGKVGKKLPYKLKAFIGVPSYLSAGLLPLAPWIGSSIMSHKDG